MRIKKIVAPFDLKSSLAAYRMGRSVRSNRKMPGNFLRGLFLPCYLLLGATGDAGVLGATGMVAAGGD